ncbi:hypothetical protein Cni_G13276 [Canna indica]|uniref:EF-hand domain-containing protein n=1 Tax=Canna indica TaxID=4628 RepID=A0AAQ3K9T5_9LILI|nr:hypothetical protein Cni_G13276 [Canna indica]
MADSSFDESGKSITQPTPQTDAIHDSSPRPPNPPIPLSSSIVEGNKKRKLTSNVWDHFTKQIVDGQTRAVCNYCTSALKVCSKNGTSSMHNYVNSCAARKTGQSIVESLEKQKQITVEMITDGKKEWGETTEQVKINREIPKLMGMKTERTKRCKRHRGLRERRATSRQRGQERGEQAILKLTVIFACSPRPGQEFPTAPIPEAAMEGGVAAHHPLPAPALIQPSSSFRLRTQSLNTLRLRRVFDLFDHNGDGEITIQEIGLALDRLGLGADDDELRSTIAAYIPPGRAGLAFEDFEVLHRALGDALFGGSDEMDADTGADADAGDEVEEDMREAFRVFDDDGDGFISAGELQAVLTKLGLPEGRSIDRVREMICSVDRNADGRVDFGEFKSMMQGITVWGA